MQQIPSQHEPGQPARPADSIRRLPVPQGAPPYDDEPHEVPTGYLHAGNDDRTATAVWQPRGPEWPDRAARGRVSPRSAAHSANQGDLGDLGDLGDQRDQGSHRAVGGAWPGQFAQILAETLAGSRPQRQLAPWTTEQTRRQMRQLGPLFATGERPLVRRVMTAAPASGVLELTAIVGCGSRIRVLAVRLERQRTGSGWCCTAIESA